MRYLRLTGALVALDEQGYGPILDAGLLDSAVQRPAASAFGEDAYPTLTLKASALMHSVAKNHALVDGNKRAALLLTDIFLRLNGHRLDLDQDEAFDLVMDVATGSADLEDIEKRLKIVRLAQGS